jgi:hypothetical protein
MRRLSGDFSFCKAGASAKSLVVIIITIAIF